MSLSYKEIIKSSADGGYVGWYPELRGCITQAETLEEMKEMLEDAKLCWISSVLESGQLVPEPNPPELCSRDLNLKIPKSLHQQLAVLANSEKVSMNELVIKLIVQGLGNETEYLSAVPGMKEKIIDGMNTPLKECVTDEGASSTRLEKLFEGYHGDTKCAELDWGPDVSKEIIK